MRTRPVVEAELSEVEREMRYLLRFRRLHTTQQLRMAELRGMQTALKWTLGNALAPRPAPDSHTPSEWRAGAAMGLPRFFS